MIFRDFREWCKPRLVTGVNKVRWFTVIVSYKTVTSAKQYFLIPSELIWILGDGRGGVNPDWLLV